MELAEARAFAADLGEHLCDSCTSCDDAIRTLAARLDEIDRRAQQIRGGLKPYARPPEIVDFLLATPPTAPKVGE